MQSFRRKHNKVIEYDSSFTMSVTATCLMIQQNGVGDSNVSSLDGVIGEKILTL